MRLQVKVREFVDFVSLARRCASPLSHLIYLGVWLVLPVHVSLRCLVLLRLLPHLLLLLRLLRLLHMRDPHPCMTHTIRGRTRVGFRVPREGGVPKVGFPVRPKICVLFQRWRQGLIFGWPAVYGYQACQERCGHTFPPQRFLTPDLCHLDTDWTSGNQWAGRRCVEPHGRRFGCERVTPELVCSLPILTTFGWDGCLGDHTRPPGLRQGTTVCVHTSMDMEQLLDHKPMTPSGTGLLVCVAGSHPSCRRGVQGRMCQRE